jgi:hypothetical protein
MLQMLITSLGLKATLHEVKPDEKWAQLCPSVLVYAAMLFNSKEQEFIVELI